jgi:quercetin dioxygenase-like cupin family protein
MSKDLAEFPGNEALMISLVYPPEASGPIHRHDAYAFLYVVEGSVVMHSGRLRAALSPGPVLFVS